MEFGKQEIEALELATKVVDGVLVEINELELALIGGGTGAVSLG